MFWERGPKWAKVQKKKRGPIWDIYCFGLKFWKKIRKFLPVILFQVFRKYFPIFLFWFEFDEMVLVTGAAQMYENGVLAYVDVKFLADVHIRAYEDVSACGRYFCFNQIVNTEEEALKLVESLSPLIPMPPRYILFYNWL